MTKELVELSITSYIGSIGAEHYYGRFSVHTKSEREIRPDGSESWITRGGYGVDSHPHDRKEVERQIGAKEAAYLNKKDGFGSIYRPGDEVNRFCDRQSIIDAAKLLFPTLFDADDILVVEERRHHGVYDPLVAPDDICEGLLANRSYADQRRFLIERGYLRHAQGMSTGTAKTAEPVEGEACQPGAEGMRPNSPTQPGDK